MLISAVQSNPQRSICVMHGLTFFLEGICAFLPQSL
jgi:hypothetical protein